MAETRAGAENPQRHQPVSGADAPSSTISGALEAALSGGPERHHEKTEAQGKLPVRERVARLVDPGSFSEEALLALVGELNADDAVDGILVQLPLPKHIDATRVIETIEPSKDVDGFHPMNAGRLASVMARFRFSYQRVWKPHRSAPAA